MKSMRGRLALLVYLMVGVSSVFADFAPMGTDGRVDVIYSHSSGGWGGIRWHQYDQAGALLGEKWLFHSSTPADIGIVDSASAKDWNKDGNLDLVYLMTTAGWSDVRMQTIDKQGNRTGSAKILEASSADGYVKSYKGVDVGVFKADGNVDVVLSGLDANGNSAIFHSSYATDGTRLSQSTLKTFTGDIGIGAVAFADIDNDGGAELFYVTTSGGIASVHRMDFDAAGALVSETANVFQKDLSWGPTFNSCGLSIGQTDADASPELLLTMARPEFGMQSYVFRYDLDTLTDEAMYPASSSVYWKGAAIVDLNEDLTVPEPATISLLSLGAVAAFYRKSR